MPGAHVLQMMNNRIQISAIVLLPLILFVGAVLMPGAALSSHFPAPAPSPVHCDFMGARFLIDGLPAPPGDEVAFFDPDGVLCGHYVVDQEGIYGILHVYGDDPDTPGIDEGASEGDILTVTIWDAAQSRELTGPQLVLTPGIPPGGSSFLPSLIPPVWETHAGFVLNIDTPTHFPASTPSPFVCNYLGTLDLFGTPAEPGDELAVFDPDGVLCGLVRVISQGQYGIIQIYGDDPDTPADEGPVEGDELTFRVWDRSHGIEYQGLFLEYASGTPTGVFVASAIPPIWSQDMGYVLDLAVADIPTTTTTTTSTTSTTTSTTTTTTTTTSTTTLPLPPTATTGGASGVGATSATLNGTVGPNGSSATYYFEYGRTPSYGSTTPNTGAGSGTSPLPVSASVTGLDVGAEYHFRLVASGTGGTSFGNDASFVTTSIIPSHYWVDIYGGNDGNNGREETPWKTLHHAFSQINGGTPGDYVIHVVSGTYSIATGEPDEGLNLSQSHVVVTGDTMSRPVVDGSRTDARAVDGNGTETWDTGIRVTGANVTLNNLSVTGFTDGIEIQETASNCTVANCVLRGNSYHGIFLLWSQGAAIVENTIYGNGAPYPNYGIYLIGCSPEIKRNRIYDVDDGIRVVANTSGASPQIWNNLLYETASGAMTNGIVVKSEDTYGASPDIYHNTLDGGTFKGIKIGYEGSAGSGALSPDIRYNIITNFGQYGIYREADSGAPSLDYNDVWNNAAGNYAGCSAGPASISLDPEYGSYALRSTSPCIDRIPPGEDPVDIDCPGYARPKGPAKDMGAYEFVGSVEYPYILPGGIGLVTDYRIFTVPLDMGTGAALQDAMEAGLGPYNPCLWRVFAYTGGVYHELGTPLFNVLPVAPGTAFWIISLYADPVQFDAGTCPDKTPYALDLQPSWNLMALPWIRTDIALGNIQVTDGIQTYAITDPANPLTQGCVWDYTGIGPYSGYEKRNESSYLLRCGTGYFIKVLSASTVRLIIPPDNPETIGFTDTAKGIRPTETEDEEPPLPPGGAYEPVPDIKASGEDGPVDVPSGNLLCLTVALDPGDRAGQNADWWVGADTPFGWYTYVYPTGWQPGIHVAAQIPLFELTPPLEVLNMQLPAGDYTFYFAVDNNADGQLDATYLDAVNATVQRSE